MMFDVRGVPVSTTRQRSLELLEHALVLTASYFPDPLAAIDAALAEDPDFIMGHCLKAGLAIMSTERAARPLLEQSVQELERLAQHANSRERRHLRAARSWLNGDFRRSIQQYGEVLLEEPRDLLALQVAHIGDFLLGESHMLRARVAQVLPRYDERTPGYSYVLGMHAFGLEETAHYDRAEAVGRRALELEPRDPWAVHAVAHVMEMQGRTTEGIAWLTSRTSDWALDNGFAFHNWWHLALFHLELGEHARALTVYDEHIRPKPTRVAYENVDASALLWRFELRGIDVGSRWASLADDWAAAGEAGHYVFNDVHAIAAFACADRQSDLAGTLGAMEAALSAAGTNAQMTLDVGLPLARALVAFKRGRYEECTELLLRIRTIAHRFGGSHAQRDLVHLTLVESALRGGHSGLARALIAERLDLKPQSPLNRRLAERVVHSSSRSA